MRSGMRLNTCDGNQNIYYQNYGGWYNYSDSYSCVASCNQAAEYQPILAQQMIISHGTL